MGLEEMSYEWGQQNCVKKAMDGLWCLFVGQGKIGIKNEHGME